MYSGVFAPAKNEMSSVVVAVWLAVRPYTNPRLVAGCPPISVIVPFSIAPEGEIPDVASVVNVALVANAK